MFNRAIPWRQLSCAFWCKHCVSNVEIKFYITVTGCQEQYAAGMLTSTYAYVLVEFFKAEDKARNYNNLCDIYLYITVEPR